MPQALYGLPNTVYRATSGRPYTTDANGQLPSVPDNDQLALFQQGLVAQGPVQVAAGFTINRSVTPFAGGGQSDAVPLSPGITAVLAPASDGDSLQLPPAMAPSVVILIPAPTGTSGYSHVAAVYVLNGSSDTMNGISDHVDLGAATSDENPNPAVWFVCSVDGNWDTNGILD
jgi:hypothetical protein